MLVLRRVYVPSNIAEQNIVQWEIPIQGLEYEIAQNTVGLYNVQVYSGDFLNPEDELYEDFEIWYKGEKLTFCTLEDYSLDDEALILTLTMWDALGKLIRAIGDSSILGTIDSTYPDGLPITYFIALILRGPVGAYDSTPPWAFRLRDVTTFRSAVVSDYAVSMDLRKEETRFSQLTTLINSKPDLFIRYGGQLRGNVNSVKYHWIDLGSFGEPTDFNLSLGDTLVSLKINRSSKMKLRGIEAFGGPAGDNARKLNLRDARNYNDTIADFITGSGYSFEGDFTGSPAPGYVVKDGVSEKGYIVRKEYPEIKLVGTPTADEIKLAGYYLYLRTLRDLEAGQDTANYVAEVVLDEDIYGAVPDTFISKTTHVRYVKRVPVIDHSTGILEEDYPIIDINQRMRIVEYRARYENNRFVYSLTLTPSNYQPVTNGDVQFYDVVSPDLADNNLEYAIDSALGYGSTTDTVLTHTGVAADTTFPFETTDAKQFIYTVPATDTERYVAILFDNPGYRYEMYRPIYGPNTGSFIVVVAPRDGDWTVADTATITFRLTTIG